MRVALLLSGKFRGSYIPFNYLEKNLISKYNPDIFINYNYKNEDDMECDESELISIYNPKLINFNKTPDIVFDKIKLVDGCEIAIESSAYSVFNMWWGIYQANQLKSKYEEENRFKYDIVIRTRFDIEILEKLELKNWNNSLFIPMGSDHRDGFNDLLAYGKSHTMDYYCSNFNHLVDYIKGGELIHPEKLLRKHLTNYECSIIRTYLPMRLRGVVVTQIDYSITP